MRNIILIILSIFLLSCNKKKESIKLNLGDTLESPPPLPEYLKDKKHYVIPSVAIIDIEDFNPIFSELLKGKKILKTDNIANSKRFFSGSNRNIYNLYYKKSIPQKAGEYKYDGDLFIYDFIYADDNQYKMAGDNLKQELQKLNIKDNYEYYDYFDVGGTCVYFLDNKEKKITIINVDKNDTLNTVISFAKKNRSIFNEVLYAGTNGFKINP